MTYNRKGEIKSETSPMFAGSDCIAPDWVSIQHSIAGLDRPSGKWRTVGRSGKCKIAASRRQLDVTFEFV